MSIQAASGWRPIGRKTLVDRWFYVGMAAFFALTAFVGFFQTSSLLIAGVSAGTRPAPPMVMHVHAVLMVAWLAMLLLQTGLAATGRIRLHRTLGLASLVLAPAVALGMAAMAVEHWTIYTQAPEMTSALEARMARSSNIFLEQIRAIILFGVFFAWAILARRRDFETHKRMMLLATLMPLSAGIDRLGMIGLPTSMPGSYDLQYAYMFLWMAPGVAYDIARRGRPHRAYVLGLGILLLCAVISHILWSHPWWLQTAPWIMGVR